LTTKQKPQLEKEELDPEEKENYTKKMKLVWSPETASKAYIDTVKFVSNFF
jgi:hypothetical protein